MRPLWFTFICLIDLSSIVRKMSFDKTKVRNWEFQVQVESRQKHRVVHLNAGSPKQKKQWALQRAIILCCGRRSCIQWTRNNRTKYFNESLTMFQQRATQLDSSSSTLNDIPTISDSLTASKQMAMDSVTEKNNADQNSIETYSTPLQSSSMDAETSVTTDTHTVEQTSATVPAMTINDLVSLLGSSETTTSSTSAPATSTTTSTTVSTTTTSTTVSTTSSSTSTTTTSTTSTPTTTPYYLIKPQSSTTKAPMIFPTCATDCVKDQSFFKGDRSLEDPDAHGFWRTACGQLFVFGKVVANWEQNVLTCCRLGMTPIIFENETQAKCFEQFINGPEWKFNTRYWTAGLRLANASFRWCQSDAGNVPATLWGQGQPTFTNNTDNCAQMIIDRRSSTFKLDDRHCGALSAVACQMNFFSLGVDGKTPILKNLSIHGTWVNSDNKSYVFSYSNNTKTFTEALTACCAIGMKLISLHLDFKFSQLASALKTGGVNPDQFWTSGTDLGCKDNYGYCSVNRLFRNEAKWKIGQPDNLNGNEHCVAVEVNSSSALLLDVSCVERRRYVCEARVNRGGVSVIDSECASIYNLTITQIKRLLTSIPTTLQEKCYIRCVGEGVNVFVNGKLVEERLVAQFSSISGGDMNMLMDMYSTMNFCSNITRGMDLCDKAAKLLECGRINSPDALASLMSNMENTFTEAPVLADPPNAICPIDYKCLVEDEKKAIFDLAPNGTILRNISNILHGKVTHACGKKYFFFRNSGFMDFVLAFEACCSLGLRMLTIETKEELDCLNSANPTSLGNTWVHVAASRMEVASKPTWCFTGQPVNMSWALDGITANNPGFTAIYVKFQPIPEWCVYASWFQDAACESV